MTIEDIEALAKRSHDVRFERDDRAGHRRFGRARERHCQGLSSQGARAGGSPAACREAQSSAPTRRRSRALPCNLSDGAAVDQLVPRAVEALGGKLDILVNNAGVTRTIC